MCVKQAEGCGIEDGDLDQEIFDELLPALAGAESLVLNGIGEPLLHPRLEEFVRRVLAVMLETARISFQAIRNPPHSSETRPPCCGGSRFDLILPRYPRIGSSRGGLFRGWLERALDFCSEVRGVDLALVTHPSAYDEAMSSQAVFDRVTD